jgi:hypothetical protein
MNFPEIRMLQQSEVFVRRLFEATRAFGGSNYSLRRRVNWSHRLHTRFYQSEAKLFTANVTDYLAGRCPPPVSIDDVYKQRVLGKKLLVAIAKVIAHWLFLLLGSVVARQRRELSIYRKAYVDDIELVFDPKQPSVLRAVYPFPVSLRRQAAYLAFLRRRGYPWMLTGNRYALGDLARLLLRRNLRSLQRLESRAQIRNAFAIAAQGFGTVQMSDEFDLGSLDFARALARRRITVVNSAHGVGKYLPVHAYGEFHVLTGRQQTYYITTRPCLYVRRMLNERAPVVAAGVASRVLPDDSRISFVFLSGTTSYSVGEEYLSRNETEAFRRLSDTLAGDTHVRLMYRPHPNNHLPTPPSGFELLTELEAVNGRPGTLFASFSSTCQIDPAFKGRKILMRGELMSPETWFDDTEEMMNIDELIAELRRLAGVLRTSAESARAGSRTT